MKKRLLQVAIVLLVLLNMAMAATPAAAYPGMDPTTCTDGSTYFECCWSCNWPYSLWCECEN